MCFSASASFIVSGGLGILGLLSIRSVKHPRYYLFSAIPLLFAVQQAAEGFVWLYNSGYAAMIFLFFALVVWPTMIPAALFFLEPSRHIRHYLILFVMAGSALSLYLFVSMLVDLPTFSAEGHHIVYIIYPMRLLPSFIWSLIYCSVTILPFFISSLAYMELFGTLIGISCLVSYLFFTIYFTSVWCFFAAIISAAIVAIVRKN